MGILGLSLDNGLVVGTVSCSGETSHNGWIIIGEWWICWLISSSELDSAHCFPLSLMGSASGAESDPSASLSDLDGGSVSLSWSWMSSLGSPRYGLPVGLLCSNSCHCP